jgi:hypothetical protein
MNQDTNAKGGRSGSKSGQRKSFYGSKGVGRGKGGAGGSGGG